MRASVIKERRVAELRLVLQKKKLYEEHLTKRLYWRWGKTLRNIEGDNSRELLLKYIQKWLNNSFLSGINQKDNDFLSDFNKKNSGHNGFMARGTFPYYRVQLLALSGWSWSLLLLNESPRDISLFFTYKTWIWYLA